MDQATATKADATATTAPAMRPLAAGRPTSRAATTARTRANILAAASRLFIERGFGAVSLRDIAAEAGLSHPGVLRHFASKDDLLLAVVEELASSNDDMFDGVAPSVDVFPEVARRNAETVGYLPLFTTLAGEATSTAHPAHAYFQQRHTDIRERSGTMIRNAIEQGALPADLDPVGEAIRIAAAWDGLQLISLYLPDRFDLPAMLEAHVAELRGEAPPRGLVTEKAAPPLFPLDTTDAEGYAPGRARRLRIISDASALFANRGFHSTSLREIAEHVGIGKSTLAHHFSSKEELLEAVIARRDATIDIRSSFSVLDAPDDQLRDLTASASQASIVEPGLIELYAVLSAEAAAPKHPAHWYFERRFEWAIDRFSAFFETSATALKPGIDPVFQATWLIALWDGLQLQWLYDPESIDVGEHLAAHLARLRR